MLLRTLPCPLWWYCGVLFFHVCAACRYGRHYSYLSCVALIPGGSSCVFHLPLVALSPHDLYSSVCFLSLRPLFPRYLYSVFFPSALFMICPFCPFAALASFPFPFLTPLLILRPLCHFLVFHKCSDVNILSYKQNVYFCCTLPASLQIIPLFRSIYAGPLVLYFRTIPPPPLNHPLQTYQQTSNFCPPHR